MRPMRWRPYLMLAAFAALMIAPGALAPVCMIAILAGTAAFRLGRLVSARRGRSASAAAGATVLGTDGRGRSVTLTDDQLSSHALILGASGAGKSTTLLRDLTDHIRRGRPVVAIDLKGSPAFARELAEAANSAGRPFRLWTPDGPGHWNPLQHGNATELKDKLIATERFTEPHYQRAAERYVQRALQVLQHAHPGRAPTLEEVVEVMDPQRMPRMLRGLPAQMTEQVQDYLAGMTADQGSAVAGLRTRLAILTESHTGQYLAPRQGSTTIDIRGALAGPEVVLFSLNSSKYGKLAAQLGTLVIQDLVAASGSRLGEQERSQAVVGIDEFSGLGADHVVSLLVRCRESGITVLVATQELADLERAARGLRDQVIGVTAVKIAHRQEVPASARAIAEMAGTEKVWQETRQIGGRVFGYDTGRGTRRQVDRFVVEPNEIARLRRGQAVVITKLPIARTRMVQVTPPERPRERGGPELA